MKASFRKPGLTMHITFSVGWLGAVAGFLCLALWGWTSQDAFTVRSAYAAMGVLTQFVIVPFCVASLLTGIVQSLCTPWGLFKHYWVLVKLLLTVLATILLLLHRQPIYFLESAALSGELPPFGFIQLRRQLLIDAGAALGVLLVNIALSVYKPWGKILSGVRKQGYPSFGKSWQRKLALSLVILLVLILVMKHLSGDGVVHH